MWGLPGGCGMRGLLMAIIVGLSLLWGPLPASAWTAKRTCSFFSAQHLHEIGTTGEATLNTALGIIPHSENHGEGLVSHLSFAAPVNLVGSFLCLGFSSEPHADGAIHKPPCGDNPYNDCPPCAPCDDERKILMKHHCYQK